MWQWIRLEEELPATWTEIRVALTVPAAQRDRAAALLGGANPLRRGDQLRLFVSRREGGGDQRVASAEGDLVSGDRGKLLRDGGIHLIADCEYT